MSFSVAAGAKTMRSRVIPGPRLGAPREPISGVGGGDCTDQARNPNCATITAIAAAGAHFGMSNDWKNPAMWSDSVADSRRYLVVCVVRAAVAGVGPAAMRALTACNVEGDGADNSVK